MASSDDEAVNAGPKAPQIARMARPVSQRRKSMLRLTKAPRPRSRRAQERDRRAKKRLARKEAKKHHHHHRKHHHQLPQDSTTSLDHHDGEGATAPSNSGARAHVVAVL